MRLATIILILTLPLRISALEIEDFKSGLMCGINKDDMGWVCFEQRDIHITGQSSCVSQGKPFKCTWYGYSFNYKNAEPGQKIDCIYSESEPTYVINLDSRSDAPSKTTTFSFVLDKESGYFVNPQYSVLTVSGKNVPLKIEQNVVCQSKGIKLYEYGFSLVYPPGA